MRLPAVLLLLLVPAAAHAGPKKVLSRVFNHVTLDLAAGGSSAFATAGTYDCRHDNGPEPCTGHYGSAKGIEITRAVATLGAIAWSEYGRRRGYKDWWLPAAATAGFNFAWGAHEFTLTRREHEKPDTR